MAASPSPEQRQTTLDAVLRELKIEKISTDYKIPHSLEALPQGLVIFTHGPLRGLGVFRLPAGEDSVAIEGKLTAALGTASTIRTINKEYLTFVSYVRMLGGLIAGLGESLPRSWRQFRVQVGELYETVAFDPVAEPDAMKVVSDLCHGDLQLKFKYAVSIPEPDSTPDPVPDLNVVPDLSKTCMPRKFPRSLIIGSAVVLVSVGSWFGLHRWNSERADRTLNEALEFVGIQAPIPDGASKAERALTAFEQKDYAKAAQLFSEASVLYAEIKLHEPNLWDLDRRLSVLPANDTQRETPEFKSMQDRLIRISAFRFQLADLQVKLSPLRQSKELSESDRKLIQDGMDRMR